ncbi:MAG: nucleotidyl transferase AbiEii/AbiGii toxin family protein [Bacteroidales bacterium]|nr:nucleotidyl transferase AbiEii/AbiGii toxin family protein [Bacteroidales bacterium]
MAKLNTPFYLTGGTALSKFYFNHRYSDDLDFFVNKNDDFIPLIKKIFKKIEIFCKENNYRFDIKKMRISDYFCQCFVEKDEVSLKIDFANDIETRFGNTIPIEKSVNIENVRNILSNKISALFRYEAKDIVDIWVISKNYKFNWETIFYEAKEKELGVDAITMAEIIQTFPKDKLQNINWINKPNFDEIMKDLKTITKDFITGTDNSLCKTDIKIEEAKPII